MPDCRCGVADWRGLREALRLTQEEMADRLHISVRQVARLEHPPHRCPREATIWFLRHMLRHSPYRDRLQAAGFPNPFEEDCTPKRVTGRMS